MCGVIVAAFAADAPETDRERDEAVHCAVVHTRDSGHLAYTLDGYIKSATVRCAT
jgi:hypothetical protein